MPIFTRKKLVRSFRLNGQGGSVLLFAMLIMSSVVVGSIGIGTIILEMLQQTKISDNSMLAYYAAESGVEEAIFNARKTGNIPPSYDEDEPHSLDNDARWWGDSTGTMEIIYTDIDSNGFIEVNLFDPDAPGIATNIDYVKVAWTDSCGGCSVLRASVVSWLPGGEPLGVTWQDEAARYDNAFEFVGGSATLSLGPVVKLYKLRLRAKGDAMEDVTIRAYQDDGGAGIPQPLPGQVRIEMTGQFVNARRRVIATMPRGAPLSGIFDYVIFSECSLVKGGRPISCP